MADDNVTTQTPVVDTDTPAATDSTTAAPTDSGSDIAMNPTDEGSVNGAIDALLNKDEDLDPGQVTDVTVTTTATPTDTVDQVTTSGSSSTYEQEDITDPALDNSSTSDFTTQEPESQPDSSVTGDTGGDNSQQPEVETTTVAPEDTSDNSNSVSTDDNSSSDPVVDTTTAPEQPVDPDPVVVDETTTPASVETTITATPEEVTTAAPVVEETTQPPEVTTTTTQAPEVVETTTTEAPQEVTTTTTAEPVVETTTTQEPITTTTTQEPVTITTTEAPIETITTQTPVVETTTQAPVEVTTTAAPVVTTTTTAAPKGDDINKNGVNLGVFANRCNWIKANGSSQEKQVLSVMQNYVDVCSKSIDLNKIAIEQQRFWRTLEYIHQYPEQFSKLYTIILEFAKEYKENVFNLSKFFRAQSATNLPADKLACFNNIRTLILNTIDTPDRKNVKKLIDVRKIVENNVIPEHIRGQYVAFYN